MDAENRQKSAAGSDERRFRSRRRGWTRRDFLAAASAGTAAWALPSPALGEGATITPPPLSNLKVLWVVPHGRLKPAEQVLAQTLQGLVSNRQSAVWMQSGGFYATAEAQLRREGVSLRPVASVWDLIKTFKTEIKGAVVYKLGTPSLNVATSLCGPIRGIAVDESLLPEMKRAGLKIIADVRNLDDRKALAKYRALFARGILVEQSLSKPGNLRDFAVARRAFTFDAVDSAFRREALRSAGPRCVVYGWGPDEYQWISDLSREGATAGPADWCLNLSVLQSLPAGRLRRPARPQPRLEENARYIAFVMSDGDNIQWLCGGFADSEKYWGSPLRGKFPMTWEVSPLLADVAPRVLQYLYATAQDTDGFVTGAGVPGYTYPHFQPDPAALARQAAPLLRESDLPYVSVLNANEGSLAETAPLLELAEVDGVLYKDFAPYNRSGGKLAWHRGKPCLSYRFLLWEGLMSPEDVARETAKLPAAPQTDPNSYAIVNVHAWSYGKTGGPMEAIQRTIALLPPNTRVITADQLLGMLRAQFGKAHEDTHI